MAQLATEVDIRLHMLVPVNDSDLDTETLAQVIGDALTAHFDSYNKRSNEDVICQMIEVEGDICWATSVS
jgi:hypothetical protein